MLPVFARLRGANCWRSPCFAIGVMVSASAQAIRTPPERWDKQNRRVHLRLTAAECRWLTGARLKYGPAVRLLDISAGGVRIETAKPLPRGARIALEFAGPKGTIVATARVLRSTGASTGSGTATYANACAFERPPALEGLVDAPRDLLAPEVTIASWSARPHEDGFQKVVARYRDGRILRGYTNDFASGKAHLHLRAKSTEGPAVFVPLGKLKALFFVKDFTGNRMHGDSPGAIGRLPGRTVEVTFEDGEVLLGSTLNYRPDGEGFFVHPADDASNNLRVFVTHAGVRFIRFL